jgi:hypothetical protein
MTRPKTVSALDYPARSLPQPFGQAVALRGVEHDKAFEKQNRAGFAVRGLASPCALLAPVFAGEPIGVKDRLSAFPFPNAPASGQRLPKGQPIL